jgi:hypothetical protein
MRRVRKREREWRGRVWKRLGGWPLRLRGDLIAVLVHGIDLAMRKGRVTRRMTSRGAARKNKEMG